MMRSFVALRDVKLGLRPDHIFVARLRCQWNGTRRGPSDGFYRPAVTAAEGAAGRGGSDRTSTLPRHGGSRHRSSREDACGKWKAMFQLVSEGYFPVLKIQFVMAGVSSEEEVE